MTHLRDDLGMNCKRVLKEAEDDFKRLRGAKLQALSEQNIEGITKDAAGVYVIYNREKIPLYVGSSKQLGIRLKQLLNFDHTFSWRLVKKYVKKKTGISLTTENWKDYYQNIPQVKDCWEKMERFLESCSFRCFVVGSGKYRNKVERAELLEHLAIRVLEPENPHLKKKLRSRSEGIYRV